MRSLLDPDNNYLKTEKNVQKYLRSLSDSQIKSYYEAIEFTPFPSMLAKEYSHRFKQKTNKIHR
ncbi:MAG: hypothetical protein KC483_06420 [Nitrosarchaeum sp.]|nr:hypothetical protein [Nitrosarchaeum sp.]MCA9820499.1 hypothetical protein [Nitrosarchaeum sp.]